MVLAKPVGAQFAGTEVTSTYQITDQQAMDGDILVTSGAGIIRADMAHDVRIFGVMQTNPVIVFRLVSGEEQPVMRSGVAMVNVTSANGAIAKGDFITSSENKGKGQKATKSGYTLGMALENLNGDSGKIAVAIKIEYAEISSAKTLARLMDVVGAIFFKDVREPGKFVEIMRNVVAALIVLTSFFFAFITFSRSVPKAIEAIGRNPLARRFIYISMMANIGLIVVILAFGIIGGIIVLRVR